VPAEVPRSPTGPDQLAAGAEESDALLEGCNVVRPIGAKMALPLIKGCGYRDLELSEAGTKLRRHNLCQSLTCGTEKTAADGFRRLRSRWRNCSSASAHCPWRNITKECSAMLREIAFSAR